MQMTTCAHHVDMPLFPPTRRLGIVLCAVMHFPSANFELEPVADAYVRDGQYSNVSFPTGGLVVKNDNPPWQRESLLKWNLGVGSPLLTATLRLRAFHAGGGVTSINWQFWYVADDNWGEDTVTWDNRPNRTTLLATVPGQGSGTWVHAVLDATVLASLKITNNLTLLINADIRIAGGDVTFGGREHSTTAYRPLLNFTAGC